MADDPELLVHKIAHRIGYDIDVSRTVDAEELDNAVFSCVTGARDSLDRFELSGYQLSERQHIAFFIEGMRHSHQSVRKLLRGDQSPTAVDASAIARLQVENVFSVCFFLQSPENVRWYLRSAWKKKFERFLLHRAELGHLERCSEYYNNQALTMLIQLQKTSYVSDEERLAIETKQTGTGAGTTSKLARIEDFPGPQKVIKRMPDPGLKNVLARLNAEYEYLCSFAHGDGQSVFFKTVVDQRSPTRGLFTTSQIEKIYQEQVLEPPIMLSSISCALMATAVSAACPDDIDLRAKAVKAWMLLTGVSLNAIPFWNAWARNALGIIGGTA